MPKSVTCKCAASISRPAAVKSTRTVPRSRPAVNGGSFSAAPVIEGTEALAWLDCARSGWSDGYPADPTEPSAYRGFR